MWSVWSALGDVGPLIGIAGRWSVSRWLLVPIVIVAFGGTNCGRGEAAEWGDGRNWRWERVRNGREGALGFTQMPDARP